MEAWKSVDRVDGCKRGAGEVEAGERGEKDRKRLKRLMEEGRGGEVWGGGGGGKGQ